MHVTSVESYKMGRIKEKKKLEMEKMEMEDSSVV